MPARGDDGPSPVNATVASLVHHLRAPLSAGFTVMLTAAIDTTQASEHTQGNAHALANAKARRAAVAYEGLVVFPARLPRIHRELGASCTRPQQFVHTVNISQCGPLSAGPVKM